MACSGPLNAFKVSEPSCAILANRFVELAVVAKRLVVVAPLCPIVNTVVDALVTASNKIPDPHVVSFAYGVVVPIPALSVLVVSRTTAPSSVHPPADADVKL